MGGVCLEKSVRLSSTPNLAVLKNPSLLMGLLQWTPYVSTKVLLGVCVYIAGLTLLEKKPTQSKIARTLGNVSHDVLNRLAKPVNELYQQILESYC